MRCDLCRSTFAVNVPAAPATLVNDDVAGLHGLEVSQGAGAEVLPEAEDAVHTFRCPACGADLVVSAGTNEATIRCHWCRNRITTADRIANGASPDGIIPFSLSREQALAIMEKFLSKRRTFASRRFLAEFTPQGIQPVYFPYFIVDVNARAHHAGQAGHLIRRWTEGSGKDSTTYYDWDAYAFERQFNLYINDLLIENNLAFANTDRRVNTHNIINSMAPWNTHAMVPYSPLYLQAEYRAEPRTGNIPDVRPRVMIEATDISRRQSNTTMTGYNHGIRYEIDELSVQGERWVSALCPVWLSSYLEVKGNRHLLHYIAVNGSTGEVMGSVPTSRTRMLVVAGIAEVIGVIGAIAFLIFG